ncbi:hypothetical protein AB0N05_16360 [Nocardia sp. NPDC051030]|uniref:hypothetical protein n=1 Tax=Nocardia sp. NPDC051030 TaxID=3155162 RepID=UPI0034465B6E
MNKKLLAVASALVGLMGTAWLVYTAGGFLLTASPAGIAIGASLAGFGVMAAWLIASQIRFGMRADRLLNLMVEEGDPRCYPEIERTPSGRVNQTAAARYRDERRRAAEESPEDWRMWFLLGGAHEMAKDHRSAVAALRMATTLQAQEAATGKEKVATANN